MALPPSHLEQRRLDEFREQSEDHCGPICDMRRATPNEEAGPHRRRQAEIARNADDHPKPVEEKGSANNEMRKFPGAVFQEGLQKGNINTKRNFL